MLHVFQAPSLIFLYYVGSCLNILLSNLVHAVVHLVEALRYKLEGSGFGSRLCHCNISLT
jgi:hypothetical protein